MISFCLLFSVNLSHPHHLSSSLSPLLLLSLRKQLFLSSHANFQCWLRVVWQRCQPRKFESKKCKLAVAQGWGGGSCQQCWQSVNPARCAFSSMISCVVPFPLHSPCLSLLSLAFSALPLTFAPLPLCTANEQCWRLRCKRVDRQLGLCANIWHGRGWRVIEKGRGARDC